jgi:hypothetical protein
LCNQGEKQLKPVSHRFLFDAPGTYRIRVRGHVAAHWTDALGGLTIYSRQSKGKPPVTTLSGELIDQASLMGVLTALYEMGYTLLDVKRLPSSVVEEASDSQAVN